MTATVWFSPARETELREWLSALDAGLHLDSLTVAASDASPRRYWRLQGNTGSRIVMDAPPEHNQLPAFIDIQDRLLGAGLRAPQRHAQNLAQGFLLLEDLGPTTCLPVLQTASAAEADGLMRDALATLVELQTRVPSAELPAYDEATVRRELALFPQWCVQAAHGVTWGPRESQLWARVCDALVGAFAALPQGFVYRDFMPRNLMAPATPGGALGLLDFQDAVHGPLAYDVISLLRDAFHSWDEEQELDWAIRYWERARKAGLPWDDDFGLCWRAMEWCGLQRHLKILGLFNRLKIRDGKAQYAQDLPRFFAYAIKTATRYRELAPLVPLLDALRPGLTTDGFTLR
ncbi:aminoglycoside phosphotransferase family protein [Inhella gelatinilytica]|uniref:Phosphotransferase n=1 Tax=Inhella gelatinilytica TaxID=2795030 RepID=A0A931IXN6_9BURK|nr:phosphotransferase [Inhella gelatinilytica]MBH9551746.1 phosphotransferase [Inhella gelatinilytica]